MTELLLLAVTKMLSGLCIGGVIPGDRRWLRPVKEGTNIVLGDVRLPDGALMRPFDIVSLNLGKARPQPPHVEDVLCDFIRPRPQRVRHVPDEERAALLQAALDPHPEEVWQHQKRSLTLFQPPDFTASFFHDAYSGKFEARLAWPGCGSDRGYPVTDLRWRALGRTLLPNGGQLCLTWDEIRAGALVAGLGDPRTTVDHRPWTVDQRPTTDDQRPTTDDQRPTTDDQRPTVHGPRSTVHGPLPSAVYLALGLSRSHQGQLWPIVVGVHLLPDYPVSVDLRNL